MSKGKKGTRTPVAPLEAFTIDKADSEPVKRQVVVRRDEVCNRCGAVNSFRKSGGFRTFGTVVAASARCRKCGLIAQIRAVKAV
jgi:ribosomal protein L40E